MHQRRERLKVLTGNDRQVRSGDVDLLKRRVPRFRTNLVYPDQWIGRDVQPGQVGHVVRRQGNRRDLMKFIGG